MEKEIEKQKGITISDILGAIRKSWILLLIIIVSVTVIGAIYTFGITKKKYYAEGSVSVEYKESENKVDTTNSLRYVNTIGDFLIDVVYNIWTILLLGLIGFVGYIIYKKFKNRRNTK